MKQMTIYDLLDSIEQMELLAKEVLDRTESEESEPDQPTESTMPKPQAINLLIQDVMLNTLKLETPITKEQAETLAILNSIRGSL